MGLEASSKRAAFEMLKEHFVDGPARAVRDEAYGIFLRAVADFDDVAKEELLEACAALGLEGATSKRSAYELIEASTKLTGHCVKTLKHGGDVYGLAVLEGGQLVSGGGRWGEDNDSGSLRVWAPATGVNVATMVGKGRGIAALPGGRFAAFVSGTNKAAVWDPASPARPICEYTGHTAEVSCVASLPDNLVASGSGDSSSGSGDSDVHLWKADTGAHVATLQGHTDVVLVLAVLSDGRLASGSLDCTVRLWDVSNPASAPKELNHDCHIHALAVLDGGILACAGNYQIVYLWDVKSASAEPTCLAQLEGHTDDVRSLAALPQGLLASGSDDKTVRVWNVAVRTCVAELQGHTGEVCALAALPDGRLASGSSDEDGEIRVWELRPQTQAEAQAEAQRQADAQRQAEAQSKRQAEAQSKRQAELEKKKQECVLQ